MKDKIQKQNAGSARPSSQPMKSEKDWDKSSKQTTDQRSNDSTSGTRRSEEKDLNDSEA